jgi:putative ABC transport system substrate-binding protein
MTVTIGRRELLAALGGAVVAWPLAARAQQSERTRHVAILMSGAESDPETQARLAGIRRPRRRGDRMKRRDFIALLGGMVIAWPLAARAQQSERTRHVAILMSGAESDPETQARLAGIRQGLSRFGWSEGRNVEIDYRYASASAEQARLLARDLVALKPEVIVAPSVVVATALQRETRAIPIVFVGAIDPVGAGLVATLARPGGNLTGTLLNEEGIVGKWLAMLKEMAPQLARVAIL